MSPDSGGRGRGSGRGPSPLPDRSQAPQGAAPSQAPDPQSGRPLAEALATVDPGMLDAIRRDLRRNLDTVHHVVHRPPSLILLELLDALDAASVVRASAHASTDFGASGGHYGCADVAAVVGTSPGTVRRWCIAGLVPGASKAGRDWRIPTAAIPDLRRRAA